MDMGSFMQQFVQQLINGISLGSIYALVALGYTMIYGIIKLINFAHGDIYMLGAYFGFIATTMFGFSFIPAILFSMACAALAGIIIERVAYRPMRNAKNRNLNYGNRCIFLSGIQYDPYCNAAAAYVPGCV